MPTKKRKYPNWETVMDYANGIRSGDITACTATKQMVERFFNDLENPDYEIDNKGPEFCIGIIERTLKHQQGEAIDGTPLRGKPFLLQPFQKFIIYNLIGFMMKGTNVVRFHESLIYVPRKNGKSGFAGALAWSLSLWYRKSGAKCYITSAALMQSLESFGFMKYNVKEMGEDAADGGMVKIIDNNNEHSMEANLSDGSFFIRALAANPDKQDSLNCNIAIADEIHAYKKPKQYNLFKEAMKAYTNKLLIGISTAGDDEGAFLGQRLKYCRKILDGSIKDEQYFVFIAEADKDESGEVDFTNPEVHKMANPNYGVTIRPDEIMQDAVQALNDPQQRKDFFAKSLNVYTNSMKSWFDIDEFRRSDMRYNWSLEELAQLPVQWYGGADLSRMYDLTAAALYGQYEDVDIIITHAFFPVTQAHRKADEDNIPLFGWADDGWLTMCNSPTVNVADVVNWFISMRDMGFEIRQVGHDRKFAGEEYIPLMRKNRFRIVDQPQLYYLKSRGFRRIEKKAKDGQLYYLHSEAYEYCVGNIRAIEKTDDAVQYEKVERTQRIDLFDASVFAVIRGLEDADRKKKAQSWFGEE